MKKEDLRKCVYCGESFKLDFNIKKCPFCNSVIFETNDEFESLLNQGQNALKSYDFSDADELYFNAVNLSKTKQEKAMALYGRLLAHFGVVLIRSFSDNKFITTFANVDKEIKSLKDSTFYKSILDLNLNSEELKNYQEQIEELDANYARINQDLSKTKEYDAFICVKISLRTDSNKNADGFTIDSKIANDVYNELIKKNQKVFYSDKCLKGVEYDSQILSALVRSKNLIIISSSKEYLESQWVQSEWRRWINFINLGEKKPNSIYLYTTEKINLPYGLKNNNVTLVESQVALLEKFKTKSEHNAEQVDEAIEYISKLEKNQNYISYVEKINQEIKLLSNVEKNNLTKQNELKLINQNLSNVKKTLELDQKISYLNDYTLKSNKWALEILAIERNVKALRKSLKNYDLYIEQLKGAKKIKKKIKKEKRIRKIPLYISLFLILLSAGIGSYLLIGKDIIDYNKAEKLIKNGNYEEAKELLNGNSYRDSKNQVIFLSSIESLKSNYINGALDSLNSINGKAYITYDPNGGAVTTTSQVITNISQLLVPTNYDDSYTWEVKTDSIKIKDDEKYALEFTLVASYTTKKYSISYDYQGGNGSCPTTYDRLSNFNLTSPTRKGYVFVGWEDKDKNVLTEVKIDSSKSGDLFYKAIWKIVTYTITYELYDGVNHLENPTSFTYFDSIILKSPTKEGKVFDGWYLDSNFKTRITKIEQGTDRNLVLYAKWR